jgi:hypothetical protein
LCWRVRLATALGFQRGDVCHLLDLDLGRTADADHRVAARKFRQTLLVPRSQAPPQKAKAPGMGVEHHLLALPPMCPDGVQKSAT